MAVYDKNGDILTTIYDIHGNVLAQAYDINGNPLLENVVEDIAYDSVHSFLNLYAGGLIEIQPDSWDGSTVVTGDIVSPSDPTAWGFPMSLSSASKASIKNDILKGNGYGISFIRFPMGFGYRGYRNIDQATGLAKNIGQRWEGQNSELHAWFSNIILAGGGLDVEYWCPAPYWLTGGAYYNANVRNELWAGGSYPRETTLASIRTSDSTQYNAQIEAFTDAIVNDLEYVHQNVAPVRMYTLSAEPSGGGQEKYGHCRWTDEHVYNDVLAVLHPKVMASQILATYDEKENEVLMHLCADNRSFGIGRLTILNHENWIWGFSHDINVRDIGDAGADTLKDVSYPLVAEVERQNKFICEYEYFNTNFSEQMACANNIVRMIFELVYGKAKIIMPLIHICKPTGQTASTTNTKGYCIYAVNMSNGTHSVNTWSYNSWKLFNDNLPIGAEFYQGGDGGIDMAGYVIFKKDGKSYIIMGNYASVPAGFSFTFDKSYSFTGKKYDISNVGTALTNKSGSSVTFDLPPYSGCIYVCDGGVTVSSVVGQQS